jgi:hypothetical protein
METKDYLTLFMSSLSLLVAAGSYFLSSRTKATTDIVEVVSRKNEIVNEYQAALFLIAECRFYTERLSCRARNGDPFGTREFGISEFR